ncbi:MAG TPA: ABC transporter permease [Acidimicrobiales bacterium]|nr:ABC transporter permease [Acidimicrobiales bacterium]
MTSVVVRRLLSLLPLLLFVSIGVFAMSLQLDPDRAARVRAGGADLTSFEALDQVREELRLDDPVAVRYLHWVGDVSHLDLGQSLVNVESRDTDDGVELGGRSVSALLWERLPRTISIAVVGLFFALLLGVPAGLIGGLRPGTLYDRLGLGAASLGLAIPSFWVAMLLVLSFSINRSWFPAVGYSPASEGVWEWFRHLIIPGLALSLPIAATLARFLRASLVDVLGSPYIRTAWAKGGGTAHVVARHALRNAAAAPLTVMGIQVAQLFSGAVVIEELFGIEGVGGLVVSAVRSNDVTVLQGVVVFFVLVTVGINLLVDVLHAYLNPKVQAL